MTQTWLPERVVLMGYGEVGRIYARQIARPGVEMILVDPVQAGGTAKAAQKLRRDLPGDLAGALVLGLFPARAARDAARQVAARGEDLVYVDLSSSPRDEMRACAALFATGARGGGPVFVDGAIMGSIGAGGAATPILLSGEAAARAQAGLTALGFDATALPGSAPGGAGALKLLRSLLTKGIEALAIESFATAERLGLGGELRANLRDFGSRPFPELLDAMVRSHVLHAPRRAEELAAAIAQAEAAGVRVPVSLAALETYRDTAARIGAAPTAPPAHVDAALAWLSEDPR